MISLKDNIQHIAKVTIDNFFPRTLTKTNSGGNKRRRVNKIDVES